LYNVTFSRGCDPYFGVKLLPNALIFATSFKKCSGAPAKVSFTTGAIFSATCAKIFQE
jgi:hypothetical protein